MNTNTTTADTAEDTAPVDLIKMPAAARRLDIDTDTAYRWARNGTFPGDAAILLGVRRWRVSVPKLERYLHGTELASGAA